MNGLYLLMLDSDPFQRIAIVVLTFLLYLALGVVPLGGFIYAVYFLLTLPMRRNERARLFLDLLGLGLKEGRTADAAILDAASSRDSSLGARFHFLAAYLEQGVRLSQALDLVPRLLPPHIRAMLKAGERIGDVQKVLPACRQSLKDGVSQVRGALNYVILLAFVFTPLTMVVPLVVRIRVMPKFRELFRGMFEGSSLPAFTRLVFAGGNLSTLIQLSIIGLIWLAMLGYVGGPRLRQWVGRALPGLPDALLCRLPWRRKRLQRDFSAMLAVLLDAEVPEAEAVDLAAAATANTAIRRRANRAVTLLNQGVKLPQAICAMDDSRELQWRLANALKRGGGFLRALSGWHDALDAKAFQLEQTAAQITTTAFVLLNGLFVAAFVIAVFLALIQIINGAILW